MKRLIALVLTALLLLPVHAQAGRGCAQKEMTAQELMAAANTALIVADALEARDAPVALIARVGTDLSDHGLVYSHAGFAVRDHANGRWTVVHLLNECGTANGGLYVQGLVNFFADDLINQDARIVWLPEAQAQRLAAHLLNIEQNPLLEPRYNLIARPGSANRQNSTAWMLETLAVAQMPAHMPATRANAYATAQANGFDPDIVRIAYGKRILGGLFAANTEFTDHPVSTRLNGNYPVVTVRSIVQYMQRSGLIAEQQEWRGGQLQTQLGAL